MKKNKGFVALTPEQIAGMNNEELLDKLIQSGWHVMADPKNCVKLRNLQQLSQECFRRMNAGVPEKATDLVDGGEPT